MFEVIFLPEFEAWLDGVKDKRVQVAIVGRLRRLEAGLMGDVKFLGDGVSELRIHLGAGWRLYMTIRGRTIVVMLAGGTKRTQQRDILQAKMLAEALKIIGGSL